MRAASNHHLAYNPRVGEHDDRGAGTDVHDVVQPALAVWVEWLTDNNIWVVLTRVSSKGSAPRQSSCRSCIFSANE
jgi:hypothetical protein